MTEELHPEEVITTFYLIRHGHTKATEEGRLYTDPNAELTERGIEQAHKVAAWLPEQKHKLNALLTSPSHRVRTTADIISSSVNMEAVVVEGLDEWHVGDWEGRTYLDLKKSEPELYKRWTADPIHNAPPGGESISQMEERVIKLLNNVIGNYNGKSIVLVTHAGVIRSLIVHALGIPIENFWRIVIPVGSISKLSFSANFATLHFMALSLD